MQVYPTREEKRPLIPAVCHVDGSGRLIQRFIEHTGVPMLLNTSYGLRPTSSTTKTNRSSAPPVRPSIASCGRGWICWCWRGWWCGARHRAPTRLGVPTAPRGAGPRFLRSVISRILSQYRRTIL